MPTAERRVAHRARLAEVLRLSQRGCDVRTIADRLGVTVTRAAKLLAEALASLPGQTVDDLRLSVETRIDLISATYGELIDDPDPRIRLTAANGMRAAEADRAKLLGLHQRPPRETEDAR